jgi:transposase
MDIQNTLFVGVDVHKYSHTAVVVDCFNQEKLSLSFSNSNVKKFITRVRDIAGNRSLIFGLEDINGNGKLLAENLVNNNFPVFNVPSIMTERLRKRTTHRNKSDYLDAKGVAKVTLLSHRTLPQKILTQEFKIANDIQGLVYDREFLIRNQTRIKNQLHALLHEKFGDDYKDGKSTSAVFSNKQIKKYHLKLSRSTILDKRIRRKFEDFKAIKLRKKEIGDDLEELAVKCISTKKLNSLNGCGLISTCKIIAEIKDIKRFSSSEKLVRYAGLAPRESSSANSLKRYTDHAGNRKLNKAVHFIALSQIGNNGCLEGKDYYQKKLQEGKSKLHSLRCLKRQVIVRIFRLLTE